MPKRKLTDAAQAQLNAAIKDSIVATARASTGGGDLDVIERALKRFHVTLRQFNDLLGELKREQRIAAIPNSNRIQAL